MGARWRRTAVLVAVALIVVLPVVGWRWPGWLGAPLLVPGAAIALWQWFRRPAEVSLDDLTSRLAIAMHNQWSRAARDRRLLEPAPLPIRWQLSTQPIAGPPSAATAIRDGQARFDPLPGLPHVTTARLRNGNRRTLHTVYGGLASGRLMITGAAGAGKSSAAVLLVLDALRYRDQATGEDDRRHIPVPVMFTLQGWDPATTQLADWITAKLVEIPLFRGRNGAREARRLLDAGRVAVFLDGLDEISKDVATLALEKLSEQATFRLVLLTRTAEMVGIACENHLLVGAVALELQPIDGRAAAEYLLRPLVAPAPAGWQAIAAALHNERTSPLTQALDNPLQITLVRDAYPTGKCVEELLDTARFPTSADVENHLLDLAVTTAYTPRPGHPRPAYSLEMARYTLGYIAHNLDRNGTRDLAWWAMPRWVRATLMLAGGFLGAAVIGFPIGLAFFTLNGHLGDVGIAIALLGGFILGLLSSRPGQPARAVTFWRRSTFVHQRLGFRLLKGISSGFAIGFVYGFAAVILLATIVGELKRGLVPAFQLGLVIGIALAFGFVPAQIVYKSNGGDTSSSDPRDTWRQDWLVSVVIPFVQFFIIGFVAANGLGLAFRQELWIDQGLVAGALLGLFAIAVGVLNAEITRLTVSQAILRVRGRPVPVRMLRFLEDARSRQLLRTVGPVYQFRHAKLQDRLASRYRSVGSSP